MAFVRTNCSRAIMAAGLLICFSGLASADSACTVPDTVTLSIIPVGCGAFLVNGPITFTGVVGSGAVGASTDVHNIEFDSVELFGLSPSGSPPGPGGGIAILLQGIDHDITSGVTVGFGSLTPSANFQTNPGDNSYVSGATDTIVHFIDGLGPGGTWKLNLGETAQPSQQNFDIVTSTTVHAGGNYTISSFFDIFTEISLDACNQMDPNCHGNHYVLADDDFSGTPVVAGAQGAGAQFQLANAPEPATTGLFAAGLIGLGFIRRRRNALRKPEVKVL